MRSIRERGEVTVRVGRHVRISCRLRVNIMYYWFIGLDAGKLEGEIGEAKSRVLFDSFLVGSVL